MKSPFSVHAPRPLPLVSLVSLSLTSLGLAAQEPLVLDELVVTASGYEQQVVDAPASISVISREEIERGAFRDVTDVLRDVPGVIVTGGGSGDRGADITMRGMPSSYTLMLVDGKRVSSRESRPNGSAGFEQDWLPPMGAIERIEVIRGPMSTLYGSDALGGVINVITRKVPQQWGGELQLDTVLQEDQDSGNIYQTNFFVGGPLATDLLGLQIYGRQYTREEDQIIDGYEEKQLQSVTGRLSFTPTEDHDFMLESGIVDQHRRGFMGVSEPTEDCGRGGCSDSESEHFRKFYALSHTGRWSFGNTDSYVQRESTHNESRDIEITNTLAKSSVVVPLGDHIVSLGTSYEEEELKDQTTNQISDRTRVEGSQWALFAEDEWLLTEDFSLTGGVRLDDDENYGSHVSPRLYGVWGFAPRWTVKGGVSTGFRSPNLREVTPDWGQISRGGDVYGNPDLEPETSVSKEISLHYRVPGGFSSNVTVFHNDFEDKITRVACPATVCTDGPNQFGSDPTTRVNVDEAITRGVEFALRAPIISSLEIDTSYTYTDSEQKSGEYEGEPLTQLPKHIATVSLRWFLNERVSPWLSATYRGEESQPNTGPSQDALVAPSYTLVDTGLGYQLTDEAEVKAGVYNLLDKSVTTEEYGLVEDGRRYWLALNIGF
ncbi:ligand-gated channel protein [Hydrocarboniclastica marina]|uniref:Ligand-gated channel protein n=1 Tax=Hydrocarboniclastica marina TaxID=2259620 RepID=A0A4P7XMV5_9ALTE|nr:ligand-gated channel protein [Hydrocarboniclastica marina]QCF27547.1 ligand-gated channel protein [Hydrocarboniclastica marina]